MTNDLVVLAPGFLGFDHFGGFPYFAQTVSASLRVALEDICRDVALQLYVVPCGTVPAGSLVERQAVLLQNLTRSLNWVQAQSSKPTRLHVVGHSTGGLDAELLTLRRPLAQPDWSDQDQRVRSALRSVITLAAPLSGTSLADAALVQLLATNDVHSIKDALNWPKLQLERISKLPSALPELFPELVDLLEGLPPLLRDDALKLLAGSAWYDPHAVLQFVNSLRTNRKLLHDLQPAQLAKQIEVGYDTRCDGVHRAYYVAVARGGDHPTPAGRLFDFFYGLTARYAQQDAAGLAAVEQGMNLRLAAGRIPVIAADPQLPPLTAAASDGIVNSLRQIPQLPGSPLQVELDRVAAVVVADHLDVLGYFPSSSPFAEAAPNGFLASGSNFRAAEFSALYRSIARQIAESIV